MSGPDEQVKVCDRVTVLILVVVSLTDIFGRVICNIVCVCVYIYIYIYIYHIFMAVDTWLGVVHNQSWLCFNSTKCCIADLF